MAEGLTYILKSLKWYMALSRPFLKEKFHGSGDFDEFRNVMTERIVELYSGLLVYQVKCAIRRFDTWRIVRAAQAMIGLEDWKTTLKDFQKIEAEIQNSMKFYTDEVMTALLAEANIHQHDIVQELQEMNQKRQ
jgi:hypothetical protein